MRKTTIGLACAFLPAMLLARPASAQKASASGSAGVSTSASPTADASASKEQPPAQPAQEAQPDDEWAQRDRQMNEAATLTGGVGLLHTQHAQGGAPGQFRLGFTAEMFSASEFLCTSEVNCPNPRGTGRVVSDAHDHVGGRLNLSVQIAKWLEAYGAISAIANSNEANRPSLLQTLGDTTLGAKVHGRITRGFHVGGALELWLLNGTGGVGLDGGGTSAKFRGLATADLRELKKPIPLRFSTNLTYVLDNSGKVVESTENARAVASNSTTAVPITRIERFGLGINRVDHFDIHLGGEVFLAQEKVRPFVEYQIAIPINRQNYLCRINNPSNDKCLANEALAPSSLTLGGRFFPWKRGFHAVAAFDIGITGVGNFIEEVAPTPPWMLYLGAGWAFDTKERPPTVVEKLVPTPVAAPKKVGRKIRGFVHEQGQADGIANAIVAWDSHPDLTSLATSPDGRFVTHELPDGAYTFAVRAEGFKPGTCTATIGGPKPATATDAAAGMPDQAAGEKKLYPTPTVYGPDGKPVPSGGDVQVDCALESVPRAGNVVGHVKDAEGGAAVAGAQLKLVDSAGKEYAASGGGDGAFRLQDVALGEARVTATADGYVSITEKVDVKPRVDTPLDLTLAKRGKGALVTVGKNEIVLKAQVQFAVSSAVILPESTGLLSEIAEVMIQNPRIRKVEIQGHTDNTGTPDRNKTLSEERASAVLDWLVAHGVASDRMTSRGFGQSKPLAPNVTAQNRAKNRRVQFIILEQDGGGRPSREPPF